VLFGFADIVGWNFATRMSNFDSANVLPIFISKTPVNACFLKTPTMRLDFSLKGPALFGFIRGH
jgi:hypothetical protein